MTHDYYELLGVGRDADEAEIKKAYHRLAMQHHPDRVGPEQKQAAEELRDPEKRATYDRYGAAGLRRGAGASDFGFAHFDLSEALNVFMRDFGGLGGFDALFGGGRGRPNQHRGQDLKVTLKLELAACEAYDTGAVHLAYRTARRA